MTGLQRGNLPGMGIGVFGAWAHIGQGGIQQGVQLGLEPCGVGTDRVQPVGRCGPGQC